jgi:glutathione S-transferase
MVPASQLVPAAGTMERYRVMEWLNFISTELHKTFGPFFNPAASDDTKAAAHATLAKRLDYVAQQLAGRDYLMGSQFTVADGYLFTVLGWAAFVKFSLADWPVLQQYSARVAARPAVQQAMRSEGLIK